MASINRLKVDQVLWTVTRQRAGNTRIMRNAVHAVRVISIDLEKRTVVASWNSNPSRTYYEYQIKSWKVKEPKADPLY